MRSIVVREFGAPQVMQVEQVPDPTPSASQVLVRVKAVGVNPVDTYIRSGVYAAKPPLPYTPGHDGAGDVVAVGADVTSVKPGDRVYIAGDNLGTPHAGLCSELVCCAPTQLHRLPAHVSYAQGAAIGVPYATAYYSLFRRADARPGETVLVHGASGGVGIASVELARAHGMFVIGTASSERGRELVKAAGAHVVVDHKEPGYLEAITRATGGKGVNVILEMAAHVNLDHDLTLLSKHGRVVIIGSRGRVEIDPRGTMGREASIHGMLLFNVSPAELSSTHAALVAGLENGTLKPVVGHEFPLQDAPKAHEMVMSSGAIGKVVITL